MEETQTKTKFCKFCGAKIPEETMICTACGRQVETIKESQPQILINNTNKNVNHAGYGGRQKNKWTALLLCLFLGFLGAHKFYEEKAGLGVLYLLTFGLFGFGIFFDLITIICKPNPYFV